VTKKNNNLEITNGNEKFVEPAPPRGKGEAKTRELDGRERRRRGEYTHLLCEGNVAFELCAQLVGLEQVELVR
jgi:hypothetical protein